MNREIHVRFWESAGVRLPCATQPLRHADLLEDARHSTLDCVAAA